MTRPRLVLAFAAVLLLAAPAARAWDDVTGDRDMPWLGDGGRARLFARRSSCLMCPTGSRSERRWGRSGWRQTGEDPYDTVARAFAFLDRRGILADWPDAFGEGTVSDGVRLIETRAAPYRFTVVMLQPTVVVMQFDLGALVMASRDVDDQSVGTPWIAGTVRYGTRIPGVGSLSWFSPDADQPPVPLAGTTATRAAIVVRGVRLPLERQGDAWVVLPPTRAE